MALFVDGITQKSTDTHNCSLNSKFDSEDSSAFQNRFIITIIKLMLEIVLVRKTNKSFLGHKCHTNSQDFRRNFDKEFFEHIDCHEINPPCKLDDSGGNFGNLTKISYSLANFFTDLSRDFNDVREVLKSLPDHLQEFI